MAAKSDRLPCAVGDRVAVDGQPGTVMGLLPDGAYVHLERMPQGHAVYVGWHRVTDPVEAPADDTPRKVCRSCRTPNERWRLRRVKCGGGF